MAENYICVSFKTDDEKSAMLQAMLMHMGFEGVEEREDEVVASIPDSSFDQNELDEVFNSFDVSYTLKTVAQKNWNADWEKSFEPVRVNDFAAIRASFHEAIPGVKHDIIITPKMSFGTGHHATTFLMIEQMSTLDFKGQVVIDFGTGTGVLAILAEKLGGKDILAIDNDEWSIDNANENISTNACTEITLQLADEMVSGKTASIILANINLNVIIANIQRLKQACIPETNLLLSGLLVQDETQMREVLSTSGFGVVRCNYKDNWMSILAKLV